MTLELFRILTPLFGQFVDKKAFYITVGKIEGLITRIFKQLYELNKLVNQIVGALNAGEKIVSIQNRRSQ